MNHQRLFAVMIAVAASAHLAFAQQTTLKVKASITLSSNSDGFEGRLELLEDSRITSDLENVLWQSGGPDMALDEKDPRYKRLTVIPLQNAVLRLLDNHSRLIQEMKLEREQARIHTEQLIPGHRTILVTTDLSAGFGSYSGPSTEMIDISHGKIDVVSARDSKSGRLTPIYLASTLKTAWELVPSTRLGPLKDILEIACRPNDDASKFYVTYTRYFWNGSEWVESSRRVLGFWEADSKFPPTERFPKGMMGLAK